jgi:hypothetical protein
MMQTAANTNHSYIQLEIPTGQDKRGNDKYIDKKNTLSYAGVNSTNTNSWQQEMKTKHCISN